MCAAKHALIYASGSAKRWARCGDGADIPSHGQCKQLLEVEGVPVICRTIKQCMDRNVHPVVITPHKAIKEAVWTEFTDLCIAHAVDFLDVGQPELLVETIRRSIKALPGDGPVIGLLGDCFYSEDAMNQIVQAEGLTFFGRMENSRITGGCAELFAWTWNHPEEWLVQDAAISAAIAEAEADPETRNKAGTPYGGLWQLYRVSVGLPIDSHSSEEHFVTIYDFTDDFDTPEDYARWTALYARRMIKQEKHVA